MFTSAVYREEKAHACVNYGFPSVACAVFGQITVRLCQGLGGNYYIYKLPKPNGCFTGYCVDPVPDQCPPTQKRGSDGTCIRESMITHNQCFNIVLRRTTTLSTPLINVRCLSNTNPFDQPCRMVEINSGVCHLDF